MQELENPPRVGLLGEWGGGRERAGVPPALGWVMVMFQSTQRWHCPLHRHPGCAMGSCKLCSASKSAGQRLMDVTATGWGCHHRGKMGFKLICCASTACTNLPSCSVSISFWPHFSMESRPKLLISGGSFTLPCQHPLLLLSFPELAAIPSYLLTHSVLQLSSSSLLPKTFALTICRVDPALLQYLEKKNVFSATFFSQKLSAEMEFSLYEMLGLWEVNVSDCEGFAKFYHHSSTAMSAFWATAEGQQAWRFLSKLFALLSTQSVKTCIDFFFSLKNSRN